MHRLKGKYERAPEEKKCKVPKDCNIIEWAKIMRQNLDNVKEALCQKCVLYIPNDTGKYAIYTDSTNVGIRGV